MNYIDYDYDIDIDYDYYYYDIGCYYDYDWIMMVVNDLMDDGDGGDDNLVVMMNWTL